MENNEERKNNSKRLAILALLLALLALAFGFAAFSKSVDLLDNKEVSYATFRGGVLSIKPNKPENGKVYPTSIGGALAEPATLTENGIINIMVHFTAPGQSATYSFYGINPTKVATFLNSIYFGDRECTPGTNVSMESVKKACDNIVMTISVKNDSFKETVEEIDNHVLNAESNEPISVTIEYLKKGPKANGSFSVDFGDSFLTYGDID